MGPVDFVITNPRHHLAMFAPVIERLRAQGVAVRVLSLCELRGYVTPAEELNGLDIEWMPLMPVRLSKDSQQLRAVRDRAAGRARGLMQDAVWRGLIRWNRRLTGRPRPAVAVLPNDAAFPYDRIADHYRRDGVPFLLMQEGVRFELPLAGRRRQYGQGGAQAVAAWGDASVEYFRGVGVPNDRIHAIGNPRLDAIRTRDWSQPARALRASLGLDRPVLLVLTNPVDLQGFCTREDKHRQVGAFLRAAAGAAAAHGLTVVVKIHPAESLPAYRADAAAAGPGIHVVRDAEVYALFTLAAVVVVLASTVGLEAMLFDLPVGVLEVPGAGFVYDFVAQGAAVPLYADRPAPGLDALLADDAGRREARRRYLGEQIANLGRSAEAAAALIGEIARPRMVAVP
ncbi:MAG TPA: hypothetical protein VGR24_00255 [bacterium]|jgi:hypothetical protein|nr:hypothetical protein [bacterium]